jgi:hypothetical protein
VGAGLEDPYPLELSSYEPPDAFSPNWLANGNPMNLSRGCVLDGIPVDCSFISSEAAVQCPNNDCGPRWNRDINGGRGGYEYFHATMGRFGQMYSGYVHQNSSGQWVAGEGSGMERNMNDLLPHRSHAEQRNTLPILNNHELLHQPNCMQNAVPGSPGLGRPFDPPGSNPDDQMFHYGPHALSPAGGGVAVTLPALAGTIIDISDQGDGLLRLYVKPDVGNFIIVYGDLVKVSKRRGRLNAGDVIGTLRPAGDPIEARGLHLTLVRNEYYNDFRKATKSAALRNRYSTTYRKYFIDPLSNESPVNCVGAGTDYNPLGRR